MKKNKHIGSSFESFLEEKGIFEEVNAAAEKAVIARRSLTLNRAATVLGKRIEISLVADTLKK